MTEIHHEPEVIQDGIVVTPAHTWWECACGNRVERYRGQGDVSCVKCGQWFNAFGQRLRDNWQDNPSNWDEDISDLDGYEQSFTGEE